MGDEDSGNGGDVTGTTGMGLGRAHWGQGQHGQCRQRCSTTATVEGDEMFVTRKQCCKQEDKIFVIWGQTLFLGDNKA